MILEIYEILSELSEKIGNSCRVGFYISPKPGNKPSLIFRIDWPNDFHFQYELTASRMEEYPMFYFDFVVEEAIKAYTRNVKS